MNTLFTRIFLWFWASLAVLVLISFWMPRLRGRDPREFMSRWGDPFTVHQEYARGALARDGHPGLLRALETMNSGGRREVYAVDRAGREFRGQAIPPELKPLLQEIVSGRKQGFIKTGDRQAFVYALGSGDGADSLALIIVPPSHRRRPLWPPPDAGLIIVLILAGGGLCYALARHLTAPVARLREAATRLASGDLSARVRTSRVPGAEEMATLERDFNTMAERLQALVHSHQHLLRDVSHELRSPLARLRLAVALAEQDKGETTDPLFQRIERESERLESMIGQILTLSRLEAEGATTAMAPLDLTELLERIVADAAFEAQAKGGRVTLTAPGPVPVHGDPSLLSSAVENVVRNAVRVSPPGATVELELLFDAGGVELKVHDRGPGVPASELERIFDPFTRGDESRDRASGGSGLGLAIARQAVLRHGGTIAARLRDGGGLTVVVQLPAQANGRTPGRIGARSVAGSGAGCGSERSMRS